MRIEIDAVGNITEYEDAPIVPAIPMTQVQVIQHFTSVTTKYIEDKITQYNVANGVAFADIDAFTKYAVVTTSSHNAIAIKFITYADNIWKKVREYQATATTVPTDVEFKVVLDSVVF